MAAANLICTDCKKLFEVVGTARPGGSSCPDCLGALVPAPGEGREAEVVVKPAAPPVRPAAAPRKAVPRLDPRRDRKAPVVPSVPPEQAARKKKILIFASMGGIAALLLIAVLVVALSGPPPRPPEPDATPVVKGGASTAEALKERRAALREDLATAEEAVAAARKDPGLAVKFVVMLEKMAERAKGGETEAGLAKALGTIRSLVPKTGDEKIVAEVAALIDGRQLGEAAQRIRTQFKDLSATADLVRRLEAQQLRIADLAPVNYEALLAEAKALAAAGKFEAARARVLEAAGWGVRVLEERANKDAAGFAPAGVTASPAGPAPAPTLEERAKMEVEKLEPELLRLEAEGKLLAAALRIGKFPAEFKDTAAAKGLQQRLEALRVKLGATVPEPERKTAAAAVPGLALNARGPRAGEYKPGGLAEADRQKKQAELAGEVRKEKKGSAKAAAAKRAEWLAGLEKEMGIYDITTIADKGDVARRVDIVIVSSGFPKSDAKRINQMAESLRASLLKVDPFRNYPDYINFHRINVDDAGTHEKAKIPFRVQADILTCDYAKAREYAKQAPSFDLVVVLCNVANVRATGGPPFITIDASLDMGRTFLHEMGHAFASLSDEYVDETLAPGRPFKDDEDDPWLTNVTAQKNPKLAKWHYWLMDAWPAPHEVNRLPGGHKVGAFEGGAYQSRGVYRPEAECLMRMGDKYCVVCFEHVEKRFYRLIAPIDDARPRRALVGLWGDESTVLEGDAIRTIASGGQAIGKFEGFWYVDGKPRSASAKNLTTALTLQGSELSAGTHEAALRVDFSNKRVRRDDGWLSSSIGWKLDVVKHKRPKWDGPEKVPGRIGQPVVFEMKIENPDSQLFRVEVHAIPEGATYDGVRFTWTPEKIHQGAWRPRFVLTDGLRVVERAVEIAVLDTSEKNFEPIVALMEARSLTEGEKSEVLLDVVDVDGDNLVFTSPNLPEGAQLDVYEGVIRWTPSPRQAGKYPGVVVEVSDGRRKMKGTIDLIVEDKPSANFSKDNLLDALRAPGAGLRKRALEELGSGDWAKSFQFLEAARLLRDKDKEIRGDALATLQKLEGEAEAVFLSMMIRDLEPHVWHFTDHKETLKWLEALASKVPAADADGKALRGSLKAIDRYNKERGF